MKSVKYLTVWTVLIFASCLGDKKNVNIDEMSDTSFINESFDGNKINYSNDMSSCSNIKAADIAKMYNVDVEMVMIMDGSDQAQKLNANGPIGCQFYIKTGENDFEWLRGSMSVQREIKADEYMGDVAQATGSGEDWQEAWALKKSMSKSAVWVPELGKAALWNSSKNFLEVKFEGYTLNVVPLRNKLNKIEVGKQRDYKDLAIQMVKRAGYCQ